MTQPPVEPPTAGEVDVIREEFAEFVQSSKASRQLHLAADVDVAKPFCEVQGSGVWQSEWRTIPTDSMPKGYRSFCSRCVKFWRESR